MLSVLDESRDFWERRLFPAIGREFPQYTERIAAGVVGDGSECFGYADQISEDHDFGVGVSLWLMDEDAAQIGTALDRLYRKELSAWLGTESSCARSPEDLLFRLHQRRGVQTVRNFYRYQLGFEIDPETPSISNSAWFYTEECRFAAAVNGVVFRDDLGRFTAIRTLLQNHYPERIFRMRLANAVHEYAGAAQANYARCMARGDIVAAELCKTRGIDSAMDILFLLRQRYAPYYKWKYRAFKELVASSEAAALIAEMAELQPDGSIWKGYHYDARSVNRADSLVVLFDRLAGILVNELKHAGLTDSSEIFLESHYSKILA